MAKINAEGRFAARRSKSIPVYKLPKNVRQFLNIDTLYENGMAKIESGKENCLYDRCYLFEDINYINKDSGRKEKFLTNFMEWLKTMNVDFKITIANEYRSMNEFLEKIRGGRNPSRFPELENGVKDWINEKLKEANPNVTTLRYLTVSCRAGSYNEAGVILNSLDTVIQDMFRAWQSKIVRLNGEERLLCIHALLRPGKKEEQDLIRFPEHVSHDWKNDILPKYIKQETNFLELDDVYMSVLFGWKYRSSIDSDTFIHSFSHVEFPSFVTMDFAPVPADEVQDRLMAASMNNEKAINEEDENKKKRGMISTGPSYIRKRKKDEIEVYMDQISENAEVGFFMNLLMVVTAADEDTLAERVAQMQAIGKKEGVVISTADKQQLKGLNTVLPFAGRQVDYMRFFLSSSVVAFQPYYAQDIIEPAGYFYGLNRTTKQLIMGNRKLLMNPHGIIIGHTGSGKSFYIKTTEICQTLTATDDDIMILDPQNEFEGIVSECGGAYFDLTPKSRVYLNGFEVPESVFFGDENVKEKFIAVQTQYARSLVAAIMSKIAVTQEHNTVIARCTRRMFEKTFSAKKLKQPTLKMLRTEIRQELAQTDNPHDDEIVRAIYNCLEEYTEGACDMLARPSNIKTDCRLVGFGLKNVPEDNWEAVMVTIMHYLSARMEYNQIYQRATHFIIDETQVVSRRGTSADMLNTAVATFRKFGGICTMAMQNLTAALGNEQLQELFSNCSYKCFLDQGGVDANALSEIQELSQTEFNALSADDVGQGVLVWGKKVVLFDAKLSKKNPLYQMANTNFHEQAEERRKTQKNPADAGIQEPLKILEAPGKQAQNPGTESRIEEIILDMAALTYVSEKEVLNILDITQESCEKYLESLAEEGKLKKELVQGMTRYRKAGAYGDQ